MLGEILKKQRTEEKLARASILKVIRITSSIPSSVLGRWEEEEDIPTKEMMPAIAQAYKLNLELVVKAREADLRERNRFKEVRRHNEKIQRRADKNGVDAGSSFGYSGHGAHIARALH